MNTIPYERSIPDEEIDYLINKINSDIAMNDGVFPGFSFLDSDVVQYCYMHDLPFRSIKHLAKYVADVLKKLYKANGEDVAMRIINSNVFRDFLMLIKRFFCGTSDEFFIDSEIAADMLKQSFLINKEKISPLMKWYILLESSYNSSVNEFLTRDDVIELIRCEFPPIKDCQELVVGMKGLSNSDVVPIEVTEGMIDTIYQMLIYYMIVFNLVRILGKRELFKRIIELTIDNYYKLITLIRRSIKELLLSKEDDPQELAVNDIRHFLEDSYRKVNWNSLLYNAVYSHRRYEPIYNNGGNVVLKAYINLPKEI